MCILGYNLYRKDHPLNIKRGGIFICHKISLPLKIKNIHYLQECIDFKIKITDKLCNFITIYCSLDQCKDDFESFINKFELNLDSVRVNHHFLTLVPDDFNAKLSLWYNNNITTNNYIWRIQNWFTTIYKIYEIWSSFFTSINCLHCITFAKFSLKIHYPPLYEWGFWHYQKANVDQIRQAINKFPLDNRVANISINENVQLFTQTIQNIISNYIPHETITCDDRNHHG